MYVMLDSTMVRAHQQAAAGRKKGTPQIRLWGSSRGGLSTKIHLLADENGLPVDFRITPGQAAEYAQALSPLEGREAEAVIADKGYDSAEIVAKVEALGAVAVIPPRRHWKQPAASTAPCTNNATASNAASIASNTSAASAPRYCRTLEAFRSTTALACAWLRLQL